MLEKKPFGRTGLELTRIGYGSMGLRGPKTWGIRVVDDERAETFLNEVLDHGINLIDTAPDYGVCEDRIGRFLSGRRDEFVLATKCGCDPVQHDEHLEVRHHWSKEVVQRNLETSLARLRTDHIDILQFHGGSAQELQQAGLIDLLTDWKRQGIIRLMGVSSKLPDLADHIALGVFDCFQVPYSCLAPEHHELISSAARTGAGVIVRGGIAQGGPDAEIQRPQLNEVWDEAGLESLVPADVSSAQFLLRATLSHSDCHCIIVGTCNPDHMQENLAALQMGPLPDDVINEIRQRVSKVLAVR